VVVTNTTTGSTASRDLQVSARLSQPTPTITAINGTAIGQPISVALGQTITISGTGFSATPSQNTVRFGVAADSATPSAATTTQLTVQVPAFLAGMTPTSGPPAISVNLVVISTVDGVQVTSAAVSIIVTRS
jgi:hypothetical protein